MPDPSLHDKIYGCLIASWVGSAMGAITEGMSIADVERIYGRVQGFVDRPAYRRRKQAVRRRCQKWSARYLWKHPHQGGLGETEDGIERQKLIATAIIEKGGRIGAADLAEVIVRDADIERSVSRRGYDGDVMLYPLVHARLSPWYVGMFSEWAGKVVVARSCHPIGLINAGDPEGAARDAGEIGMLYQPAWSTALPSAAAYAAALAEACRPGATVETAYETARRFAGEAVREEIDACRAIADRHDDPYAMRDELNARYERMVGPLSSGEELVAKGLAVVLKTKADPAECVIVCTNFGRDTDCLAAIAAGLAGALSGPATLREDWIRQVEDAESRATDTVSNRSCRETADGIYAALLSKLEAEEKRAAELHPGTGGE